MWQDLSFAILSRTINTVLAASSNTDELLALGQKTIKVTVEPYRFDVMIHLNNGRFTLNRILADKPHLHVEGTVPALMTLLTNEATSHQLRMEGDFHLAQTLQLLLKESAIDWVAVLSPYCGDLLATHAQQAIVHVKQALPVLISNLVKTTRDYAAHEKPSSIGEIFIAGVERLHSRIEKFIT